MNHRRPPIPLSSKDYRLLPRPGADKDDASRHLSAAIFQSPRRLFLYLSAFLQNAEGPLVVSAHFMPFSGKWVIYLNRERKAKEAGKRSER